MINLAFYSDQIIPENEAITETLLAAIAANGLGNRVRYVASGPEPDRRFFLERAAHYARHGLDLCLFHDLDEPRSPHDEEALFDCDAIHLSGGHTGGFLSRLKRSELFPRLKQWGTDGGLLIGTSAGAIKGDMVCIGQPVRVKNGEARLAHSMPLGAIPASA